MSDHIIRGMAANNQVRFFAGTTRDIVETARSIHNTSPVATAALGRLLTAGALMGAQCKNESDVLTLQIQCNGPIGGLTVTADAHSRVKGYVNNPNVILHANDKGKLDVAKALDLGVLSLGQSRSSHHLKRLHLPDVSLFHLKIQNDPDAAAMKTESVHFQYLIQYF